MRLRPKRPILRAHLGRRAATQAEIAYLRSVLPTARAEQCQVVYYGGQAYICCGASGTCVPLPILGPGGVDLYGRPMRFTNPPAPVNVRSGAAWRNAGVANRWFKASYFDRPASHPESWVKLSGAVPGPAKLWMHGAGPVHSHDVEVIQVMGQNETLMALVAGWSLPHMITDATTQASTAPSRRATRFYHGGMWPQASAFKPFPLAAAAGGRPGEVCWWTGAPDYAKCCSYEGSALPICVTYPDVP